jgi:hypothetical protein
MVTKSVGVCGGLSSCSGGTGDGVLRCGLCDAGVVCRLLASESREETWLPGGGSSRGGSCASAGHCVSRAVYLFCVIDCLFQGFVVKRMGRNVKMKLDILPFIYCLCSQSHTPMKTDVGLDVVVRSEHRRNLEDVRAFAYLCLSVPVDMGQGKTSCSTKSGSCDVPRSTESWNVKETDGLRKVICILGQDEERGCQPLIHIGGIGIVRVRTLFVLPHRTSNMRGISRKPAGIIIYVYVIGMDSKLTPHLQLESSSLR